MTIAVMAASCVGSVCFLSYSGIQIPPELNTLTGGLVGALTAMLVKTSPTETLQQPFRKLDLPPEVKIASSTKDPVHTTDKP